MRRILTVLLALVLVTGVCAAPSQSEPLPPFTTADLTDASIQTLLDAMDAGRLTARRLTKMYLDRIEAYDPLLHTVIALNPRAMEEARAADEARVRGAGGKRLLGIPILVKDNIDVAGMPTTEGHLYMDDYPAGTDAEAVARLRREGAVILGKANMDLNAQHGYCSRSPRGGTVLNPYDATRTPAGSSGGVTVAVTCNFAAAGLGTDTGSSVRRPCSFANLYGLRPSHGLISCYGVRPLAPSKDTVGPVCRNPEDLALLVDILAGTDDKDLYTWGNGAILEPEGYLPREEQTTLQGRRIGYLASSFGYEGGYYEEQPLSPRIRPLVQEALSLFRREGAELVDLSQIITDNAVTPYLYCGDDLGPRYVLRDRITRILEEEHIDAVLYLSQTDVPEPEASARGVGDNPADYINLFGPVGGLPDISLPMGFSLPDSVCDTSLPMGMELFAGYGKDRVLLEIACAYGAAAQVREPPRMAPPLPDPVLLHRCRSLRQEAAELGSGDWTPDSRFNLCVAQLRAAAAEALKEPLDCAAACQSLEAAIEGLTPPPKPLPPPEAPSPSEPQAPPVREEEAPGPSPVWFLLPAGLLLGAGLWFLLRIRKRAGASPKTPTH